MIPEFRLPVPAQSTTSTYCRPRMQNGGEQCGRYLLGDFAFAIWNERERTLFCCRDHIGIRAFLYWHTGTHFVFSNSIERILSQQGVRRELNRDKLAAIYAPGQHDVLPEETYHAGIYSLAPGSWMTVSATGVRRGKYWELSVESLPDVPKNPVEAFDALRGILFEAVGCRIDRDFPAASLLSGGLDSSAIVSIAARCTPSFKTESRTHGHRGRSACGEPRPICRRTRLYRRISRLA